jgi:tripartite-type tricarboxylate transporter receptor subunit TctC
LTAELLKQKFGFDMAHVPYRNSPQSIADVAAGHVAASVAEAGASLPLIRDGKLRALAVTSATRFPTLPDVPPIGEAVGMPELEAVSWHVIFARHDTPRDIVNRLHDEMKSIMAAPDMQEKIMRIGLIPHDTPSVEGVQRYIKADSEKWGTLVRQLGLEGSQ